MTLTVPSGMRAIDEQMHSLEALIRDEPEAGQIFEPVDYEVMAALWRNPETRDKALAMADADRRQHERDCR